jgi:hypothetical protein
MIIIAGMVQVTEIGPQSAKAKIIKEYEPLTKKEMLKRYEALTIPTVIKDDPLLSVDKTPEGFIVALKSSNETATAYRVIYLDRGANDGIGSGDVFEIYRTQGTMSNPAGGDKVEKLEWVIGTIQVLAPRLSTCSAFLSNSVFEGIKVGDKIRLIKKVPGRQ